MNRRDSIVAFLAFATLVAPLAIVAQPRGKLPRIGYLTLRRRGHALEAAFVAGLRALGYVEGKTIEIEWRFADGMAEKLPALAAELIALRVDLIVAAATQAIQAAAAATTTIPVIFPGAADPVGARFVKSLSRPGGNVTGFSTMAADLGGKQIELLRAVVPRMARLGVLVNPTNAGNIEVIKNFEAGGKQTGVSVLQFEGSTPEGIERAFAAMVTARVEAVAVANDAVLFDEAGHIAALALRHKLPLISTEKLFVEAGSLMSYGGILSENYRRAATYVDKILKGAKPADLPVEQPTVIELVLNLKTAKALGVKFPHSLAVRADRVIE